MAHLEALARPDCGYCIRVLHAFFHVLRFAIRLLAFPPVSLWHDARAVSPVVQVGCGRPRSHRRVHSCRHEAVARPRPEPALARIGVGSAGFGPLSGLATTGCFDPHRAGSIPQTGRAGFGRVAGPGCPPDQREGRGKTWSSGNLSEEDKSKGDANVFPKPKQISNGS